MPESRLAKARASLPEGYQFGEGKWTPAQVIAARDVERRTSVGAQRTIQLSAEETDRAIVTVAPDRWNVIEGEEPDAR